MSKIIHIPSSKMTSLPSYNLITDNKIDGVKYNYTGVSLSNVAPYSFMLFKDGVFALDESSTNADNAYRTTVYSDYFKNDMTVLLLRKKINLDNQLISLDYYIGAGGTSHIKDVNVSLIINSSEIRNYTIRPEVLMFDNGDGFNLSSFLPEHDVHDIRVYIDISTLKYNFVDFVIYLPIEYLIDGLVNTASIRVDVFSKITSNNVDSGVIYEIENVSKGNGGYTLPENEFYQNKTVINGTPIYNYISSEILSKWSNGRQTMSLTCVYGTYYEYGTNNVVLNGLDGKMIDVGDVVIPTRLYTDANTNENSEVPIALNSDNSEKQFEVLSSEIEFNNGKLVAHLKLMEVK